VRFAQVYCPGSVFKPITAIAGLESGSFTADEDFGASGLSWQASSSWGPHTIVTTSQYSGPADLENAMAYSDNIYFAKAALATGQESYFQMLETLGFFKPFPFAISLAVSSAGEEGGSLSEEELADLGYGQGVALANPVLLACIYSSILDGGNIPLPVLESDGSSASLYKQGAFSENTASALRKALNAVVAEGTAKDAAIAGRQLGAKTGTAEVVQEGAYKQLGWFVVFDEDASRPDQLLMLAMIEGVEDRGGSHYTVTQLMKAFRN